MHNHFLLEVRTAFQEQPVLRAAGTQGNGIVVCSEGHVHFDSKMWENADYDGENDVKYKNPRT